MFTTSDAIQFVFQVGSEFVIDIFFEVFGEEAIDDAADVGRCEAAALQFDIVTID